MNRRPLRSKLLLKFRARKNVGSWNGYYEIRICSCDLFDLLKVIKVIGRDAEPSIFSQRLANRAQEFLGHDPAPPVTAFRPWVRKQKVKYFHRPTRQQITHDIRTFHAEQAHIIKRGGFSRGAADATNQSLDSEKIFLGHAFCQRANEGAVAAAKVEPVSHQIRRLRDQRRMDVPAGS